MTYLHGNGTACGAFVASVKAPYSPAVGGIMLACGCPRPAAFMAYFILLAEIHKRAHRSKHLHATREDIDRMAELPGFARALELLGWVTFEEPYGPMRWNRKLRSGYITKLAAAKLATGKGGAV